MTPPGGIVKQLRAELASTHVCQQAGRFARLAAVAFAAQLAALGTTHLTRDALAGVAVGAIEAAYRQWAPVVPWRTVAAKLPPSPPTPTQPPT